MITNLLIDVSEAALQLAITRRQLSAMVRSKSVPYIEMPNGEVRFSEPDLKAWIETRKQEAKRSDSQNRKRA